MLSRDAARDHATLVVLSLLAEGARYGYSLSKEASERSGGKVRLTPGVLYPLLKELEGDGLVLTSWEEIKADGSDPDADGRRRKWYRLSAKGRKQLTRQIEAHRAYREVIDAFLGDAPAEAAS